MARRRHPNATRPPIAPVIGLAVVDVVAMSWLALALLTQLSPTVRRTSVEYRVPSDCPSAMEFVLELTRRTEIVRLTDRADASAFLEIRVDRSGRRYAGTLRLRLDDGSVTTRQLGGPKCESVVKSLALAAALVLDPENAKTGPLDEPPPPPVDPVPPPPAPEPPSVEPPPIVTPPPVVEVRQPLSEPPPSRVEAAVFAGGLASNAVSSAFDFGGGASGLVWFGERGARWRFLAALGAGGLSGRVVESANGRARYAPRLTADAGAGVAFTLGAFRVGVLAELRLEPLFVEGLDGDELASALRVLVSAAPSAIGLVDVGPLEVGVRAALPIALRKERYLIEPRGEVFAVPTVGVVVAIVVGWRVG